MDKVVSVLNGRLGNILFEAGAALTYAKRTGKELHFSIRSRISTPVKLYSDFIKNVKIEKLEDVLHDEPRKNMYENQSIPPVEIPNVEGNVTLNGYYQSEFYMDKDLVRNFFKIDNGLKRSLIEKYNGLEDGVGMSVRRTDYLRHKDLFNVMSKKYYESMYNTYFKGLTCFVTSDDVDWCKKNLEIDNCVYIEENDETCLRTLSLCKHHIMSCSTYSWWAAFLEEKKDSVNVVPTPWFSTQCNLYNDAITPSRWKKIPINKEML